MLSLATICIFLYIPHTLVSVTPWLVVKAIFIINIYTVITVDNMIIAIITILRLYGYVCYNYNNLYHGIWHYFFIFIIDIIIVINITIVIINLTVSIVILIIILLFLQLSSLYFLNYHLQSLSLLPLLSSSISRTIVWV